MTTELDRKVSEDDEEDGLKKGGWVDVEETRRYGV